MQTQVLDVWDKATKVPHNSKPIFFKTILMHEPNWDLHGEGVIYITVISRPSFSTLPVNILYNAHAMLVGGGTNMFDRA